MPGDEFASHLSLVLASLSQGESQIRNLSPSKNCQVTIQCLRQLGVDIQVDADKVTILGKGLKEIASSKETLDFKDSKDTLYLLAGILCGLHAESQLKGERYLAEEFKQDLFPSLEKMGIEVNFSKGKNATVNLRNREFKTLNFHLDRQSPLAKTTLELSSLLVDGYTNFIQSEHKEGQTEKLLKLFGVKIRAIYDKTQNSSEIVDFRKKRKIKTEGANFRLTIEGSKDLTPQNIDLPQDPLLAIFFVALAIFTKKSQIHLERVKVEDENFAVLQLLKNMGADVSINKTGEKNNLSTAQIAASTSETRGRKVNLPKLDKALPLLATIACFGQETTIIRDLSHLRQGRTDKLKVISENLRKMGAKIGELEDGLIIEGRETLNGTELDAKGNFSISLGLLLASLLAEEECQIKNYQKALDYYPNLFELLDSVCEYYK